MRGLRAGSFSRARIESAYTIAGAVVLSGCVLYAVVRPSPIDGAGAALLTAFLAWVTFGGLFDVRMPGRQREVVINPISQAVALALPLVTEWSGTSWGFRSHQVVAHFSPALPVLVAGAGLLLSRFVGTAMRLPVTSWFRASLTVVSVLLLAVSWSAVRDDQRPLVWQMVIMLVLVGLLGAANMFAEGLVWAPRPTRTTIFDAARALAPVYLATMTTAVITAFAVRPLGLLVIPFTMLPLLLVRFRLRSLVLQERDRAQVIRAVSQVTDLTGYTMPGHAKHVNKVALAIGYQLGLREHQRDILSEAALLHDVGQVSLRSQIPQGATAEAAPADQEAIAHAGADIVRRIGSHDQIADVLTAQATPHHVNVTQHNDDPARLLAAIVKVANAYVDYGANDAAIERLLLGSGYEYDPGVVHGLIDALAVSRV